MSWSAASSSSPTSPMGGSTGSTRAPRRRSPITPDGPWRYADLRPDLAPPALLRGPRGPQRRGRAGRTRSSTIPLDGGEPQRPRDGSDFVAAPRLSPDGRAARLARMGPPGHALGRDAAAGRGLRARRDARRVRPGRGRPRRVDRPARVGARRHAPPDQRPERLVEPLPPRRRARGSSRSPRWRRSSPTRPGSSTGRSYGFLPDGAIVAVARSEGRDHLVPHRARRARSASSTSPFTELDGLRVGARRRRRRGRSRRAIRRSSRASTRSRSRRPASCAGRATVTLDPAIIAEPESIEFPTDGRPDRPRALLPADQPGFRGPDGEKPPLIVLSPRRSDLERLHRARPRQAAPDQPRHRGRRRRLRREHRLWPRLPPAPRGAVGRRRRRRLRRGGAVPGRARRCRSRPAGHRGRQRRRLHDARPRLPSVTSSRPGSACTGSAT